MRFVGVEGHEITLVMRVVDAELVAEVLNEDITWNGGDEDRRWLWQVFDGAWRVAEAMRLSVEDEAWLAAEREAEAAHLSA